MGIFHSKIHLKKVSMSHQEKMQKLSQPDDQNGIFTAGSGPSNVESPPKIFKLSIDCFDEIFEYLNLKDLHSFGQTCKRMNKVTGEYFKQNYSALQIISGRDGIHTDFSNNDVFGETFNIFGNFEKTKISGFNQFITTINVHSYLSPLRNIKPYIEEFVSINSVSINNTTIAPMFFNCFSKMLAKIETLDIYYCNSNDIYEGILKFCIKLKRLYVTNSELDQIYCARNGKSRWLFQRFPKLEHFELIPKNELVINELNSFLELNKSISTFSTSANCLWHNRHAFRNSEKALHILEVKFVHPIGSDGPSMQLIFNLINELYDQGFYKRLHLYVASVDEEINVLAASTKNLDKLCIKLFDYANQTLPVSVKELVILEYNKEMTIAQSANYIAVNPMEMLANELTNLQRLYMVNASFDDILPFIRKSTQLKKIKLLHKDGFDSRVDALKLRTLNLQREQLFGARKVTIYVRDKVFEKTKWTTTNGVTDLSLIEVKRSDSYEWKQHF
ncbi:uncharacterized protein LOC116351463 isoform X1 [Contarinia nasturtii]|uniref:uncharacterized protein LOC116351463 isoform X1 n=2 Tax=Contarinia nasturtii TaxID=265458 RepID=UPI0012D3F59E|nr:uncharacterized protein LOC116351463 isoform X1 [Contarinia nasturtii]